MKRMILLCTALALLLTGCIQPQEMGAESAPSQSFSLGDVSDVPESSAGSETGAVNPYRPSFPGSGAVKLQSEDSTTLIFYADCTAQSSDGQTAEVTVKVGITCWAILVGARTDGYVRVNGTEQNFTSPSLQYTPQIKTEFPFATLRFQVPLDPSSPTVRIDAGWHFNGTYSNQPIDWLTVSGEIGWSDAS